MGFDYQTIHQAESASEAVARITRSKESALATAARGLADLNAAGQIPRWLDELNGGSSTTKVALGLAETDTMGSLMKAKAGDLTRTLDSFDAYSSVLQGLGASEYGRFENFVSSLQAPSAFAQFADQLKGSSLVQHGLGQGAWKPVLMRWAQPPTYAMAERLLTDLGHPSSSMLSTLLRSEGSSLTRETQKFRSGLVSTYARPNFSSKLFDGGAGFDAEWDLGLTPPRTGRTRARRPSGDTVVVFPDTRTADPTPVLFSLLPAEQARMVLSKVLEVAKVYGPTAAYDLLVAIIGALITYYGLGLR